MINDGVSVLSSGYLRLGSHSFLVIQVACSLPFERGMQLVSEPFNRFCEDRV